MEYNELLDDAAVESNSLKRLLLVAIHQMTSMAIAEKINTKPFNPILGETYELVTDKYKLLAEQVSHHPPITACYLRGNGYTYYTNQKTNTKFTGTVLMFVQQYRAYINFDKFNETYEIQLPNFSAHNLIIGKMYIDIGENLTVVNQDQPNEQCVIRFERRGWFNKEKFKLAGEVFKMDGKNKQIVYLIQGNWNDKVSFVDPKTGISTVIWTKSVYPENTELMYGMSHFSLQLNYFPKRLHNVVAPTDTRRRPDQRALENGDMKTAAFEKNRLENRQRTYRRYMAGVGKEHMPRYFKVWHNPSDD